MNYFYNTFTYMKTKNKGGRPKLPKSLKKVGFSTKVTPDLLRRINVKAKGIGRNKVVEEVLEKNF